MMMLESYPTKWYYRYGEADGQCSFDGDGEGAGYATGYISYGVASDEFYEPHNGKGTADGAGTLTGKYNDPAK